MSRWAPPAYGTRHNVLSGGNGNLFLETPGQWSSRRSDGAGAIGRALGRARGRVVEVADPPRKPSGVAANQLHHFPREGGYVHRPSRGDKISIDDYVRIFPCSAGVGDFFRHAVSPI